MACRTSTAAVIILPFVAVLCGGLAGCRTAAPAAAPGASTSATEATEPANADPAASLHRGMKPSEIEAVMGKPRTIETKMIEGVEIQIWTYRRRLASRFEFVAATMVEVPWIDPMTGELRYLREPSTTPSRISQEEEITLYLTNGQLAELRRAVLQERSFNQ